MGRKCKAFEFLSFTLSNTYFFFDRNFNFVDGGYQRMSATPKETVHNVAHEKLSGELIVQQLAAQAGADAKDGYA